MRSGLAVVVCGLVVLAGCGGGSSTPPTIKPPVANAGGPYTGMAGTAVSFSGAGSTDPQGEALTYAWNFGDGNTGTGVSPTPYLHGSRAFYRHVDGNEYQQPERDSNQQGDDCAWASCGQCRWAIHGS